MQTQPFLSQFIIVISPAKLIMSNRSTTRKPKGRLVALITILAIALFLQLVTVSEAVPENAKFAYDSQLKVIVPYPEVGEPAFFPVEGKFDTIEKSKNCDWDGITTWGEVKDQDSPFSDFSLPDGEGWDGFVLSGSPVPIWRTVMLKPQSRWDKEGHWRF